MNSSASASSRAGRVEAFANPDRMAVLATLHGLAARSPREAVVLELGCGEGDNLLSLAVLHPGARFVGLDASAVAIGEARATATALGLGNVAFHARMPDATDALSELSELRHADYIIARDACSHLGRDARGTLFAALADVLAPGGTAVIGFDTLPGATDFEPLRALMRFHVKNVADPVQAVHQARAVVHWHIERVAHLHTEGRVSVLRPLVAELDRMPDAELLRLLREESYEPLTLVDFSNEIEAVGLRWLTNARLDEARTSALPESLRELARSGDVVRRQQYLDYFLMTRHRTSLVCRADEPITREVSPDAFRAYAIAGRVARRHILGAGPLEAPLVITSSVGETALSDAATGLLTLLSEQMPSAVPVEVLLTRVAANMPAETALFAIAELWRADVVELTLAAPAVAHEAPPLPRTGALQHLVATSLLGDLLAATPHEASDGAPEPLASIASLWHRPWSLDGAEVAALALMDGSIAREHFDPEVLRKLLHKGFVLAGAPPGDTGTC